MSDNRAEAKTIMDRVSEILRTEFGDRISRVSGLIDMAKVQIKVDVALGATPEARDDNLRVKFNRYASMLGLAPTDFDLPLILRGEPVTLVSVEPGRSKYPFVVSVTSSGKRFKVDATLFLAARARKAA